MRVFGPDEILNGRVERDSGLDLIFDPPR
jgi:hypothetical protein